MKVDHSRVQHGVGQGSFHSATVQAVDDKGAIHRFDYVYDCGSGSTRVLGRCIDRIDLDQRVDSQGQLVLDALVLSHYDQDHLNGARSLAKKCSVSRVYLPYLGPTELALVIASQAIELEGQNVRALHALANGSGSLFSVPVTQVVGGDGPDLGGVILRPDEPEENGTEQAPPEGQEVFPLPMRIVVSGTNAPPAAQISHHQEVQVLPVCQKTLIVWRLKFWNRGIDSALVNILLVELQGCGFPMARLTDPNGAQGLIDWLDVYANRQLALSAYRSAIKQYAPDWQSETGSDKLSNFLSLGLYAGSITSSRARYRRAFGSLSLGYSRVPAVCRLLDMDCDRVDEVGWLGTGDAPLGELKIWNDFEKHFQGELRSALTMLVPHHGSAPKNGPRFYNKLLNREWGTVSVISCGKNNQYGHPKASVVRQILDAGGDLYVVNESSQLGLHEHLSFET